MKNLSRNSNNNEQGSQRLGENIFNNISNLLCTWIILCNNNIELLLKTTLIVKIPH